MTTGLGDIIPMATNGIIVYGERLDGEHFVCHITNVPDLMDDLKNIFIKRNNFQKKPKSPKTQVKKGLDNDLLL